jgi:hypothetical protein
MGELSKIRSRHLRTAANQVDLYEFNLVNHDDVNCRGPDHGNAASPWLRETAPLAPARPRRAPSCIRPPLMDLRTLSHFVPIAREVSFAT